MDALLQDLRFGIRILLKSPGFTSVAVLTLALGIGGVTAIFSVINGVMLRPLPYGEPERLVEVSEVQFAPADNRRAMPPPRNVDWPVQTQAFEGIVRYLKNGITLLGSDEPQSVGAPIVTANLFQVLRVDALLGRVFSPEDVSRDEAASVVVVSHGFWQNRLGRDPSAIGKQLRTDRGVLTVIGVMPPGFSFPPVAYGRGAELWIPVSERNLTIPGYPIARLKQGVSIAQATAELNSIVQKLRSEYPGTVDRRLDVTSLVEATVGSDWRKVLIVFFAAVACVLLIAVANVANLSLTRAVGREREIAIRTALGSTRARMIRQLLMESLVMAAVGGAIGLAFAKWGVRLMLALLPDARMFPRIDDIGIDTNVLGFTVAITFAAAFAFGIGPALNFSKPHVDRMLKEGGRSSTETQERRRLRAVIAASEIALATVLVTGSFLLAKSFLRLIYTPLGLDSVNVVSVLPTFPYSKYPNASARNRFLDDLTDRVRRHPGVQSATKTNLATLDGVSLYPFKIEARPVEGRLPVVEYVEATPDFFQVLGIPFKLGQAFRVGENAAVVNELFAAQYLKELNPIGQRIQIESIPPEPFLTIVGVVKNIRLEGPGRPLQPVVISGRCESCRWLLVKTKDNPNETMRSIRAEIASLDKDLVVNMSTLAGRLSDSQIVAWPRFRMVILTTFAAAALLLAVIGIYGVTSYSAAVRTREIGIRMALGGTRSEIIWLMLGQSLTPMVIGIAVGLAAAAGVSRFIESYLFDVAPSDPTVFMTAAFVLVATALLAILIPLRRTTSVDPMIALRYE